MKSFIGRAFCKSHSEAISSLGYPTDLREFLKSCGSVGTPVDPGNYTKGMKEKVEIVLKEISQKLGKPPSDIKSSSDSQGIAFKHESE